MDDERRRLASSRQAARIRLARAKRWVTGGALALTGLLSAVAAQWLPSSQAKQTTTNTATATATPSKQSTQSVQSAQSDQQQSNSTIAPAASAPQASSSGSGAVSGGS
jgi:type VI protein secretion system component VasK